MNPQAPQLSADSTFTDPEWKDRLSDAQLTDFDSWWKADADFVEIGNYWGKDKEKFWSHVTKLTLPSNDRIFLKRQQNHYPGNLLHRLRGRLTFQQEWKNYQTLQAAGIPTMKVVYFAYRKHEGDKQCIFATSELKGMISLEELIAHFQKTQHPTEEVRHQILSSILQSVKSLHKIGMVHNALKPKHMFINIPIVDGEAVIPSDIQTCFIDLERAKYVGTQSSQFINKDLKILFSRFHYWPDEDLIWFIKAYLENDQLTPVAEKWLKFIRQKKQPSQNNH